ncbi:hypothetical protein SAMN05446935_4852 [Burkholderia sp. YR290]|jgi:hypothetical protein|uniref:Uncharacterized protein n=1 Tax=Paraburkholderia hospita TaxID=169430 RepID=A0AAN1MPA9_9BURK|nr:hypothetical protein C2L64_40630 [Paraburkholderia hospita]SOE84417.1 hypothetical protein SAMN05446935_4852 [Burkholderia sp. YR290]OUL73770.1 hypothetical protein CA603_42805 [Paraburkholderia hospita]OUL75352.1 hypothetical protein CA601_41965 [Paraburkholderia hospita]OUL84290.1 hypothetical protein CA602_20415 [Paraburkholderia hospita]
MSFREGSLRSVVEKWFGAGSNARARVTRSRHIRCKQWRCVRVEATRSAGTLELIFFRHADGSWCVFPPDTRRLTMDVSKLAQVWRVPCETD